MPRVKIVRLSPHCAYFDAPEGMTEEQAKEWAVSQLSEDGWEFKLDYRDYPEAVDLVMIVPNDETRLNYD